MSRLFTEAKNTLASYGDDAASVVSEAHSDTLIDDSGYQQTPDDVSELGFKQRLLTDKALFINHSAEACLGEDEPTLTVQRLIALASDFEDMNMPEGYNNACRLLGRHIVNHVMAYAKELGNE